MPSIDFFVILIFYLEISTFRQAIIFEIDSHFLSLMSIFDRHTMCDRVNSNLTSSKNQKRHLMKKISFLFLLTMTAVFFSCKSYSPLKQTAEHYTIPPTAETPEQIVYIYKPKRDVRYNKIFSFKDKSSGKEKDLKYFSLTKDQIDSFVQQNPSLLTLPNREDFYFGKAIYFLTNQDGEYKLVSKYKHAKRYTPVNAPITEENYDIETYVSSLSDSFGINKSCPVVMPSTN